MVACYIGGEVDEIQSCHEFNRLQWCEWFRVLAGQTAIAYTCSSQTSYSTQQRTYLNGLLHSIRGRPAVVSTYNFVRGVSFVDEEWYQNGKLHRDDDLPAVVENDGEKKKWYQNGVLHRDSKPAVMCEVGEEWWRNGHRHRADGPAVVYGVDEKCEEWWFGGVRHRTDGPAVIDSFGRGEQWWINGIWKEFKNGVLVNVTSL